MSFALVFVIAMVIEDNGSVKDYRTWVVFFASILFWWVDLFALNGLVK